MAHPYKEEHHGFRTVRHHRHIGGAMAHIHRLTVALAVAFFTVCAHAADDAPPSPSFSTQPYYCGDASVGPQSSVSACISALDDYYGPFGSTGVYHELSEGVHFRKAHPNRVTRIHSYKIFILILILILIHGFQEIASGILVSSVYSSHGLCAACGMHL